MTDYHVEWSILIEDAKDPEFAAQRAWDTLRPEDSTASVFEVSDALDMTVQVDLHEDRVSEPVWVPGLTHVADLAEWMTEHDWDWTEIIEMIRRPHKYADQFSRMVADREFDKVAKEPEFEELEKLPSMTASKMTVHFRPEMWVNDHAVEVRVDWDQDTWNVSDETAEAVRTAIEADGGVDLDFVRNDFFTPQWICEWSGPFTITMKHDDLVPDETVV